MVSASRSAEASQDVFRFARDATTLRKVGSTLLATGSPARRDTWGADSAAAQSSLDEGKLRQWLVAKDAFETCEEASKAIYASLSKDMPAVVGVLGEPQEIAITHVRFYCL